MRLKPAFLNSLLALMYITALAACTALPQPMPQREETPISTQATLSTPAAANTSAPDPSLALMQTAAVKATLLSASGTAQALSRPTATAGPTVTPSGPWSLVWSDEFDGPNDAPVDDQKWSFDVGGAGWGNNELEYYTDRVINASQQKGTLLISALKESYQGRDYTSARLVTKNKGDWRYGRFEIRAKLPLGRGIWPAIWLMPTDDTYGGWPNSGEVDIMELLGHDPGTAYGTLIWGSPRMLSQGSYALPAGAAFHDDFHVFALEWEPGEFRWYIDGYLYHTVNDWSTSGSAPSSDQKAPFPAPFDQRFHLLLNVAVGGNWPGSPDATTPFPAQMVVDYVRVYQRP